MYEANISMEIYITFSHEIGLEKSIFINSNISTKWQHLLTTRWNRETKFLHHFNPPYKEKLTKTMESLRDEHKWFNQQ